MEDVVIYLPGINDEGDGLVGYFAEHCSLPMYDDGTIYWHTNDRQTKRAFRSIEKQTGINFKQTRDINKAEIIAERGPLDNPLMTGCAEWRSDDPVWRVKVREGKKHWSTILHEICHTLGMTHPEDHAAETDTIMSYKRDKSRKKLYQKDIDVLTGLYI